MTRTRETDALSRVGAGRVVTVALSVGTSGVLPVYLIGALAVQVRSDMAFSPTALGLVTTAFFATGALSSIFIGKRIDEVGWQRAMVVAATGQALAMVGIGLVAGSVPVLLGLLAVAGLAHAIGMPAGNLAIARNIAPDRQALVFGVRQSAIPAAVLLAGLAVPAIGLTIGWRWAFGLALVGPALTIGTLTATQGGRAAWEARSTRVHHASILSPGLVAMVCASLLGGAIVNSSSAFFVSSAVDGGTSEALSGTLLAIGSSSAIVMRVIIGLTVDRRASTGFLPMAVMLVIGAVGWVLLAIGGTMPLMLGTPLAFGAGTGWAGLMHFILVSEHPGNPAAGTAAALGFGYAGGALAPVTFGLVVDHGGYTTAWMGAATAALIAAACTLLAGHLFKRQRARTVPLPAHDDV